MDDKYDNNFTPDYLTDVTVQVPGAQSASPVARHHCLTDRSAVELQKLLYKMGHPSLIVRGHPMGKAGGAATSQAVPYFQFTDNQTGMSGPAFTNAGLIAFHWRHPDGRIRKMPNTALRDACIEVEGLKRESTWDDSIQGIIDPDLSGRP